MTPAPRDHWLRKIQRSHRATYDAASLFLYMVVVYGGSLTIGPLGRDFAALHDPQSLGWVAAPFFRAEIALFHDRAWAYHLVNLALLYACTLLVYWTVRLLYTEGPIWLATLAAAFFMASPIHSEAVLNLSGSQDLLPALAGLTAFASFGRWYTRRDWTIGIVIVAGLFFLLSFPGWIGLIILLLAISIGTVGVRAAMRFWKPSRLEYIPIVTAVIMFAAFDYISGRQMYAPLYYTVYPIGFLPENAHLFHREPWLGWLAAFVVVMLLFLISRKVPHKPFGMLLIYAVALSTTANNGHVDPVHFTGGGRLMLPAALIYMSLSVVFGTMMTHPKWRAIVIGATTLLALFMFALGIHNVAMWREASRIVTKFQSDAHATYEKSNEPIAILPDFQAHRGAPMKLSDSISWETPFGPAIPNVPLLQLNHAKEIVPSITRPDENTLRVEINGNTRPLMPWPYTENALVPTGEQPQIDVTAEFSEGNAVVVIENEDGTIPQELLPWHAVEAETNRN